MASKVLILGATGYLGSFIAKASAELGHPTYALVRDLSPKDSNKAQTLEFLKSFGITLIKGSLDDHDGLVSVIKIVDIVISAIASSQIIEQLKLVKAIKDAGNVKRFLPSEFGIDASKVDILEPAKSRLFAPKIKIRRAIEAEGIPYTCVCCSFLADHFLPTLGQCGFKPPPIGSCKEKVVLMGDGNTKVVFSKEEDVGTYTIKAIDDPRTLNKTLHIRAPENILTMNELVALWEKKIGKTVEKVYLSEEQVLKSIPETPIPYNVGLGISHASYIEGCQTRFEIGPDEAEASELYPDVKYTIVEEYLNRMLCE